MFRLAHVTDPHFRSFAGASWAMFLGKRAVGALNLVVNRRRKHSMEILAALAEELRADKPDHLALTGDLGNVSLESEWARALAWIDRSGVAPEAVTVIPGNHDTYVGDVVRAGTFERLFAPHQTAELRAGGEPYPFVRLRDTVALVGVNTCVPTGDLGAWGRIGEGQLARLETLLAASELAGRVRVVLLHHPPVVHRPGEDRNLKDRAALEAVLRRTGAELVIHGHDHRDEYATLPGPGGAAIPVVGAGSASYAGQPEHRGRFNVYEIEDGRITAVTFSHDQATGRFGAVARRSLSA